MELTKKKACSCVILPACLSWVWTVGSWCEQLIGHWRQTVQPHMEKYEIRGSPKVLVGLESSNDESWPALVSMQVPPVFYTQRWTAVTIWLPLGLGPGLAMHKLIRTHEILYNSDPTTRVPTRRARQSLSSDTQFMKIGHCCEDIKLFPVFKVLHSVLWNGYGCSHRTLCL